MKVNRHGENCVTISVNTGAVGTRIQRLKDKHDNKGKIPYQDVVIKQGVDGLI